MKIFRRGIPAIMAMIAAGWFLLPKPPLLDGVPFSTVVRDRDGGILRITLAADDRYRVFTPLDRISPRLAEATLFHEDRYFREHPGVNPVALARAAWHWLLGAARGGASTVTMQVARLRFGLDTRTPAGKLRQVWSAICLERHYSKNRILEAYFNLAPYGRNIEGVGAAAGIYLKCDAENLSWPEAVALSVIPQSPTRRAPDSTGGNSALNAAYRRLYEQLLERRIVHDSFGANYVFRIDDGGSDVAPQFVNGVLASKRLMPECRTTLDSGLQSLATRCVRDHLARFHPAGIRNAAVLLVDVHTMDVLASVGSADFSDDSIHGQVDGTRARRSPGSALKPFIYALALQQGVIHPQSLLLDAPRRFEDYDPENFDRQFCGPIAAMDALVRSRNVPAVDILARLSRPDFYEFLCAAGVRIFQPEPQCGLSLALGGAEVTMEEVAQLYATLANDGEFRPLRKTLESGPGQGIRLLSRESAFLTLDMLANSPRPEEVSSDRLVAWKTGTSHGFRDAWAAGVFDHYVLVVWLGNFDGRGNPALVGRSCAGPLFFRIVDAMQAEGRAVLSPPQPPARANLRRVELCAVSGALPGPFCIHLKSGWFIPGVSPITRCDVHREVLVDRETGLRVLHDNGNCRREIFEFWPSNVLSLFDAAGLARRTPPPFRPDCGVEIPSREGSAPRIVSPNAGSDCVVGAGGKVPLVANADSDARKVFWFADGTFLGTVDPGGALSWKATPGRWHLLAMDDNGRSTGSDVTVVSVAR